MSLKTAQHQNKCYCNSVASTCCNSHVNCFKRKATGSGSIFSVATNSKSNKQQFNTSVAVKSKQKTDFVKNNRKATAAFETKKNRRGAGHSHTHSGAAATNFSRRNSAATTVTFSTPCATPAGTHSSSALTSKQITPSPSPTTILKATPATMTTLDDDFCALSVSTKSERGSDYDSALKQEYTERRRYYESAKQLMKLMSSQSDNLSALNIMSGGVDGVGASPSAFETAVDTERLRTLQQFRLQNANECFSVHRQLDLKLPVRTKELEQGASERHTRHLWCDKPTQLAAVKRESSAPIAGGAKKLQSTPLTPHTVRQKLLRLRLEAEEIGRMKPGRKFYGVKDSCALRYQETY
ncbi:uncharacterized protein LOC128857463 [Anastrepha ludens]|uniref:uncharacterized protein LOC128857463 n=1 Tax=Anastrepha ludens TaxID=28586 RepID=UPI0023B1A310|nr:uncharacterized protein LOC128857463 [Anastrepha ludens]